MVYGSIAIAVATILASEFSSVWWAINMQGRTPLHHAAFQNETEAVKMLLCYGADATARDNQVCSFLGLSYISTVYMHLHKLRPMLSRLHMHANILAAVWRKHWAC